MLDRQASLPRSHSVLPFSSSVGQASRMPTPLRTSEQADDASLSRSLVAAFPARLLDASHSCLPSLASLLRLYSPTLSAEDLYYKTEAILMQDKTQTVTQDVIDQLKSTLQREWESKARLTSVQPARPFATPANKPRSGIGSLLGITPQTPRPLSNGGQQNNSTPASTASTPKTPLSYSQPHIIETLNPHLASKEAAELESLMNLDEDVKPNIGSMSSRVALAIGMDPRTWNYRYMFERPGMKGQALDDAVEEMLKAVLETYNIARDEIADPSVTSQETVYVVGKLGSQLSREDKVPKLSDGMVIEASRMIGSGSRTPLKFAAGVRIRGLSSPSTSDVKMMHTGGNGRLLGLFPGMIAGFKGRNGGGDAFVVEEVLLPPALPHAASNPSDMLQYQFSSSRLDGDSLQIQVASGPYTNDDDLNFSSWHRLMDQVERQKPDVILLLGPFLSAQHSSLLDPNLSELPQDVFKRHISRRLNRLCEQTNRTTAILFPSTKDIVSPHAAWPQPMFDKASLGIHKRVKCLPNPCLFSINEVVLGASTADILRDLRAHELVVEAATDAEVKGREGEGDRDAMSRTIRHVLHQRHFYPLFPATSDLPLDVTHSKLAAFPSVTPDVLILPSVLTPFARVVDGTVVVNPGACAKGSSQTAAKGSFASMQIHPMDKATLQSDKVAHGLAKIAHHTYERARVDVYRM